MRVQCRRCGKTVDIKRAVNFNGEYICLSHLLSFNTIKFCPNCKEWYNPGIPHTCTETFLGIRNYSFKRLWKKEWNDEEIYGVEIEFLSQNMGEGDIDLDAVEGGFSALLSTYPQEFILVHDGSLMRNGAELVTRPMSLNTWLMHLEADSMPLHRAINHIKEEWQGYITTIAALHIHRNLYSISDKALLTLRDVFHNFEATPRNWALTAFILQRELWQMYQYAGPNLGQDHYAMFNLTNTTLEWRGLGGALEIEQIVRNILLYHELIKYAEKAIDTNYEPFWLGYAKWLTGSEYSSIRKYGEALCALLF